jgi:prephenate dehydrogenase (NADP+)
VYLSYEEHDEVTANTQAVTHAAFLRYIYALMSTCQSCLIWFSLSMGTAWANTALYPWEHGYYVGGIETVKVNIVLRIFSNKWHVYAGLAMLNPSARTQIKQYAQSTTDIFKLMLKADEKGLRKRLYDARDAVFGDAQNSHRRPILLSESVLDQFSLGKDPPAGRPLANSHLSLLAMVDCWAQLGLNPFKHLELAATPIFRMWFGVAEYLFRSPGRLEAAIQAALYDVSHRYDDVEFVVASRGWSQCVSFGNFDLYRSRFQKTATFFEPRFEEAGRVGSEMLRAIMDSSTEPQDSAHVPAGENQS